MHGHQTSRRDNRDRRRSGSVRLFAQAAPTARVVRRRPQPRRPPRPPTRATRAVTLLVGRSTVVDVGAPITRVSLTSADIADALVTSPNQLLVNGKVPGTISMFVWDRAGGIAPLRGHRAARPRAAHRPDASSCSRARRSTSQSNGKNIVLSGHGLEQGRHRARPSTSPPATSTRRTKSSRCCSCSDGAPSNQVLLRVRFAEVSRSAMTELGVVALHQPDRHQEHHRPHRRRSSSRRRLLRPAVVESQQRLRQRRHERVGQVHVQRLPEPVPVQRRSTTSAP